ncbi:MAG: hypothetical protein ACK5RG_09830 [Cyclobacteriaceae bacterium]|nr:hypothetical protein [Flammeovirgaceae bacterium]
MKRWTILSLTLFVTICVHGQKLVRGDIEYSIATYSEEIFINKRYGALLDSMLKKSVFDYLSNSNIKNLPTKELSNSKNKDSTPSEIHVIEPLFINMATFNGVYAKRVWKLSPKAIKSVRFRCGFQHRLFIILNNTYIDLSSDTTVNKKLLQNFLRAGFSDKEVEKMIKLFLYRIICENYTFLPSFYIKKDDEILFDVDKIEKHD